MILITGIKACLLEQSGTITNKTYHSWTNIERKVENMKKMERFRHWLRWFIKQTYKKNVTILFIYRTIEDIGNNKKTS